MTEVCQSEAVRKQQPLLRGESLSSACGSFPVGAIVNKRDGSGMKHDRPRQSWFTITDNDPRSGKPCSLCGKKPLHEVKFCPARNTMYMSQM